MTEIITLPPMKRHKPVIPAREMYDQGEMPEQMVWDICNYMKVISPHEIGDGHCKECPRWAKDEDGDQVQRGCFGLAHEAAATALAWSKRINAEGRK